LEISITLGMGSLMAFIIKQRKTSNNRILPQEMEQQGIIIAIVTALTSGAAWKFWEQRMKAKQEEQKQNRAEDFAYRDDLKSRVARLEQLLEESNTKVLELTAEVHALRTEVGFLKRENDRLRG